MSSSVPAWTPYESGLGSGQSRFSQMLRMASTAARCRAAVPTRQVLARMAPTAGR
ncbi:hypothetical protein ACFW2Y_18425 [Streptomyces sp. NPDC058877]|uniref:hypothetical protein n=1 Tax=Streptomyces sp. NPDC058877 TaxID=3346665 RepID=UPI003687CDA0